MGSGEWGVQAAGAGAPLDPSPHPPQRTPSPFMHPAVHPPRHTEAATGTPQQLHRRPRCNVWTCCTGVNATGRGAPSLLPVGGVAPWCPVAWAAPRWTSLGRGGAREPPHAMGGTRTTLTWLSLPLEPLHTRHWSGEEGAMLGHPVATARLETLPCFTAHKRTTTSTFRRGARMGTRGAVWCARHRTLRTGGARGWNTAALVHVGRRKPWTPVAPLCTGAPLALRCTPVELLWWGSTGTVGREGGRNSGQPRHPPLYQSTTSTPPGIPWTF